MTQASDILEAIRGAGIPLNTTQLAEQLPHIPKPSISAACSQLRQQGVLVGSVEDGRVAFRVVAGAGPSDAYNVNVDDEAADVGDDERDELVERPEPEPVDVAPAPEKPPTQSFSPVGMEVRPSIEETGGPSRVNETIEALLIQAENRRRSSTESANRAHADEGPKGGEPENSEAASRARFEASVRARPARNDGRLCRELAAAVLARWPGEIPYDVQRLVNSAATLPL